jgi:hypothetical protein
MPNNMEVTMAQADRSPLEPGFDLSPVSVEVVVHKALLG